jgi:hypothetical protein
MATANFCGIPATALPFMMQIGAQALSSYMPTIIDMVAQRTRQLTVRLDWLDGPRGQRELKVQTFIVGLPENGGPNDPTGGLQGARDSQRAQDMQGTIPSNIPSGAGGAGLTGGGFP